MLFSINLIHLHIFYKHSICDMWQEMVNLQLKYLIQITTENLLDL